MQLSFGKVRGLPEKESAQLAELVDVFNYHSLSNQTKEKYYDGAVQLQEVNLGLALPRNINKLSIGCDWGAKAVDVLASRSMFDGFVSQSGGASEVLDQIIDDNNLIAQYMAATKDELKFGCTFATLSADEETGCRIRFHSPQGAAALWNGEKGRIDCGLAIIDTVKDESINGTWSPSVVNLYTDDAVWVLRSSGNVWGAEYIPHKMGRPLMEPLVYNRTMSKPFGRSRLKAPIRSLIDQYIRTMANAAIALEFATSPQKYILGVSDDQFDMIVNDKFKQYIGSILAATTNPETNEKPSFGQLQQGTLSPHITEIRMIATQFSAATGLSVTDTGVVNDANPTSSDAILAQTQTLVLMAEQLNKSNGDALRTIAQMAMAISSNKKLEELTDEEKAIIAHFKNPAMPSVSVTADAAIKIASSRPEFASTDTFLEMVGFDQADIRRIKAQEVRARGQQVLTEFE